MVQATSSFIELVAEMGLDKASLPVEKMPEPIEPVQPPKEQVASVTPANVPPDDIGFMVGINTSHEAANKTASSAESVGHNRLVSRESPCFYWI